MIPADRSVLGSLLLAVLAGAATVGCGIGLFATAGWLIARASEHPPIFVLSLAVVAVRGFGVGRAAFRYLERLLSHEAALRALADVRPRCYQRLERLAPAGLGRFAGGDLVARIVGDVDAVQDLLVRGLAPTATAGLVLVAVTGFVAFLYPPAAAVLAGGLLLAGVGVPWLTATLGRRSGALRTDARAEVSERMTGALEGAADLLAYGAADRVAAEMAQADRRESLLARTAAWIAGAGAGLALLTAGGTAWLVLVVAARATSTGALDRVTLTVLVLTALAAFEAVAPLPLATAELAAARRSATRLFGVLDAPNPVREPTQPARIPDSPPRLRLQRVAVRYASDEPWALQDVDLELPPGHRVAIIGSSGSGKSTLIAALLRFRDVDRGGLSLNGVEVSDLSSGDVQQWIQGCIADPHVFASSIRENLRLARPGADDEQLARAAATTGLLPWVRSLPNRWDTHVGTHGAQLSGGQRQRLAVARALLADPPVLVLDEPTAHLDPPARRELMTALLEATKGRTMVLVTHDLAALPAMDEVLVLDAGRIVARGTHIDLLNRSALYRRMWAFDHAVSDVDFRLSPACTDRPDGVMPLSP
jgi:ATP-binding cassette subfamily C protein CydC